jgi:hypothetical protein
VEGRQRVSSRRPPQSSNGTRNQQLAALPSYVVRPRGVRGTCATVSAGATSQKAAGSVALESFLIDDHGVIDVKCKGQAPVSTAYGNLTNRRWQSVFRELLSGAVATG